MVLPPPNRHESTSPLSTVGRTQSQLSLAAVFCGIGILIATNTNGQSSPQIATVHKSWDDVFTTKQGWTGGDGGGTVDLGEGRVLWMFADSFIGGIADGKHAPGSHMINNVFAVQSFEDRTKPKMSEFDFAWGPEGSDKKPTAWLKPDRSILSRARKLAENKKPYGWFWPAGGGCVIEQIGKRKLVVFLFHMGFNGKGGVWGFESIGGAMAIVENPDQSIADWKITQRDVPFTKGPLDQPENTKSENENDSKPFQESNWGMSCVNASSPSQEKSIDEEANFVYIYGDQHRKYKDRQLVVARVPQESITDFEKWEFFAGENGWVNDCNRVQPIAKQIGAEFSIEKIRFKNETKFVMVHSHHMLGPEIFVRTSDAPEGPWSEPLAVYTVPDIKKSKNYFTYAARGHSMVSPDGTLLITYIVNSNDFWEMCGDASIYRPRCITVPLEKIFSHR